MRKRASNQALCQILRSYRENARQGFYRMDRPLNFLICINGDYYWLTDPIFSDRALLPKRRTPPALSIDEMKELGGRLMVIISHNHYDHFDKPSISGLPVQTRVFVPLGLKKSVEGLKVSSS